MGRVWGYLWLGLLSPAGGAKSFRWLNLHAYPAGTSFCSCKRKQNTLGGHPETPRTGTPARNGYAVPKRRLNGAYKGLWAHLPPSPPLPRSGGGGSCPTSCLSYFSAWQVPSAISAPRQIYLPHPRTATRFHKAPAKKQPPQEPLFASNLFFTAVPYRRGSPLPWGHGCSWR